MFENLIILGLGAVLMALGFGLYIYFQERKKGQSSLSPLIKRTTSLAMNIGIFRKKINKGTSKRQLKTQAKRFHALLKYGVFRHSILRVPKMAKEIKAPARSRINIKIKICSFIIYMYLNSAPPQALLVL